VHNRFLFSLIVLAMCSPLQSQDDKPQFVPNGSCGSCNIQPATKGPSGVILVKGAWSSAGDSVTPVPEGGNVTKNVFTNKYFGMTYPLPQDWIETYDGPPPSETGRYVLAQFSPADTFKGTAPGSILITAEDMFFTPLPVTNALELARYAKNDLRADYKVEMPPREIRIAGHSFVVFSYRSPAAGMHWYDLATQIRCHTIEVVLTSRDEKLLKSLMAGLDKMQLPAEASPNGGTGGGEAPLCIKDYDSGENVIARVDPIFTEHRFNSVPVRVIIDKEGRVKHIHFLSAFPDQTKAISDALGQWKFKPYLREGKPVEVETGLMFGRRPYSTTPPGKKSTSE
jgi:hypothetical protein